MKTVMKTFMVEEKSRNFPWCKPPSRGFSMSLWRLLAGGTLHDGDHEGFMVRRSVRRQKDTARTRALAWSRTVVGRQWSLRNTARPRRSPAMPAPGSAFIILARPMAVH
jgi:hypothetical protein